MCAEQVKAQQQARELWESKISDAASACELVAKRVQSMFFKIQCDHYLQTALKDATAGGKKAPPGEFHNTVLLHLVHADTIDYSPLFALTAVTRSNT